MGLAKFVGGEFTIPCRAELKSYVDDEDVTLLSLGSTTLLNSLSCGSYPGSA